LQQAGRRRTLLKRLSTRPMGVVSKNRTKVPTSLCSELAWMERLAPHAEYRFRIERPAVITTKATAKPR